MSARTYVCRECEWTGTFDDLLVLSPVAMRGQIAVCPKCNRLIPMIGGNVPRETSMNVVDGEGVVRKMAERLSKREAGE